MLPEPSTAARPAPGNAAARRPSPRRTWQRVHAVMPRGRMLSEAEWRARHRVLVWLLAIHIPGLLVFLACEGFGVWGSLAPVLPVIIACLVATRSELERRARSVAVVFGLLTASAVLVYGWHGETEAHFHYFVMIAVIAFYEDWLAFGLAFAYVAIEHGVLGVLAPRAVFSHAANPLLWALVHGGFVLGASAAALTNWRLNEITRARMVDAHQAARDGAQRFRVAFESGISGMAMLSPDGHILQVNRALCELLGYAEDEVIGCLATKFVHPDDLGRDVQRVSTVLEHGEDVFTTESRYFHRDGTLVWVQIGLRIVRDEAGEIDYFLAQYNDITTRKRFEHELAHSALHDPLTGLANRRLFLDRVQGALSRLARAPVPLAVLFLDLDRFKLVNDTLGHAVGDAVLVEAGQRLRQALRTQDTVARFGGDEFTIVCEGADESEARRLGQRVLDALSRPFEHEGREFQLSASVGIRVNDSPHADAEALLQDADIALYAAKEKGRARLEVFEPDAHGGGADLLATEQALRRAIARDELRLHYQPEVELASGRVVAVEALVRWEHPVRGLVAPGEFVSVAEQSELILALGEWVLRRACAQLVSWRDAGTAEPTLRVAVNISGRQLSDPGLAATVAAALHDTGLDPRNLLLEITENALAGEADVALANLESFQQLGVGIALDDFGVGFSSLSRIRELPRLDVIKIDRSFVAGLRTSASDGAVIRAAVSLGAHLDMVVVAEGIEDEEQRELVCELGCHVGQGYLFARPQPPEAVAALLAAGAQGRPPARKAA